MALFLNSIISLGLGSSIGICYFAKIDDKSKQAVISHSITILLFSVSVSTILLWSFSHQIGNILFKSEAYKWHIAISLVSLGFSILIIPLQQYLQFNQKSAIFAWQSLLVNLTTIVLSLLLVICFNAGSLGMLIATALSQILSFLSLLIVTKIGPEIRNPSIAILWELVLSGIPMIPSFFLLFYLQNWVRFPLATEYGLDIAGLFSIGSNFGLSITVITNSIAVAWLPYVLVSKDEWGKHRQDLANNFLKFFIVGSVASLAFFLLAQPIVTIFTHPTYFRAWEVIGLTALSYFI
jgi:O-antigen/teichoic acid export membrane protein